MKRKISKKKVIKFIILLLIIIALIVSIIVNISYKNKNNNLEKEIELLNREMKAIEIEGDSYKFLAIERESQVRELLWVLDEWNGWSSRNQETLDILEDFWRSCSAKGGC